MTNNISGAAPCRVAFRQLVILLLLLLTILIVPSAGGISWAIGDAGTEVRDSGQVVVVVAHGTGASAEAARKDALANAVQQVVGTIVDADILVANDKVVRDEILTYSNAYVEHVEESGASERDEQGAYRSVIKAWVKKGPLQKKLESVKVFSREVPGSDLAVAITTKAKRDEDAGAMIKEVVGDFPLSTYVVEAGEISSENGVVTIPVDIGIDQRKYASFAAKLASFLESASSAHTEVSSSRLNPQQHYDNGKTPWCPGPGAARAWIADDGSVVREEGTCKITNSFGIRQPPVTPAGDSISIVVGVGPSLASFKTREFQVTKEVATVLGDRAKATSWEKLALEISLLDINGQSVWVDRVPLDQRGRGYSSDYLGMIGTIPKPSWDRLGGSHVAILPVRCNGGIADDQFRGCVTDGIRKNIVATVPPDELANVKRVSVSIVAVEIEKRPPPYRPSAE